MSYIKTCQIVKITRQWVSMFDKKRQKLIINMPTLIIENTDASFTCVQYVNLLSRNIANSSICQYLTIDLNNKYFGLTEDSC